jgi:hypothetical protein
MLYRKQNDIMKINNIKVNDIIYIFYKQEFCAIRVIINGNSNSRKMLNFLTKKHGNAGKLSNNGYGWQGKIAYMVYQLVPKGGILHIFDKAVIEIIVKENEEYGWQIQYHN